LVHVDRKKFLGFGISLRIAPHGARGAGSPNRFIPTEFSLLVGKLGMPILVNAHK